MDSLETIQLKRSKIADTGKLRAIHRNAGILNLTLIGFTDKYNRIGREARVTLGYVGETPSPSVTHVHGGPVRKGIGSIPNFYM